MSVLPLRRDEAEEQQPPVDKVRAGETLLDRAAEATDLALLPRQTVPSADQVPLAGRLPRFLIQAYQRFGMLLFTVDSLALLLGFALAGLNVLTRRVINELGNDFLCHAVIKAQTTFVKKTLTIVRGFVGDI